MTESEERDPVREALVLSWAKRSGLTPAMVDAALDSIDAAKAGMTLSMFHAQRCIDHANEALWIIDLARYNRDKNGNPVIGKYHESFKCFNPKSGMFKEGKARRDEEFRQKKFHSDCLARAEKACQRATWFSTMEGEAALARAKMIGAGVEVEDEDDEMGSTAMTDRMFEHIKDSEPTSREKKARFRKRKEIRAEIKEAREEGKRRMEDD